MASARNIFTVSSESAPSSENLDSPQTSVWSGRASCFFTISQTLSTVSFLACHNPKFEMSLCLQYKRIYIQKSVTGSMVILLEALQLEANISRTYFFPLNSRTKAREENRALLL